MSDLIERLRKAAHIQWQHDEIQRLTAERDERIDDADTALDMHSKALERIAKLEAALKEIDDLDYTRAAINHCAYTAHTIARAALQGIDSE